MPRTTTLNAQREQLYNKGKVTVNLTLTKVDVDLFEFLASIGNGEPITPAQLRVCLRGYMNLSSKKASLPVESQLIEMNRSEEPKPSGWMNAKLEITDNEEDGNVYQNSDDDIDFDDV